MSDSNMHTCKEKAASPLYVKDGPCAECLHSTKMAGIFEQLCSQPTPDQVREIVAKWLFGGRDSLRRPQFYADWYHETDASPYTKLGYMDSADELLSALRAAGALREGL